MDVERKRSSGQRPKKRKRHTFYGNQHSPSQTQSGSETASSQKLKINADIPDVNFKGYSIVNMKHVFNHIQQCVVCVICHEKLEISFSKTYGLGMKITVKCRNCGELSTFGNCTIVGKKKNVPEVNRRLVYAMRTIGRGLQSIKTFCAAMDLPPPVTQNAYKAIVGHIKNATTVVATASRKKAVDEERDLTESSDITVSGDWTWKTRGHSSLIGVCTLIGGKTGKVIDTEVLSSFCKGCNVWTDARAGPAYKEWADLHATKCVKNHDGSARKMEVSGMVDLFRGSLSKYNVRYTQSIRDGDSKTFLAIQKSKPYDIEVTKIECVGHIQKRMGSRLRQLKRDMKGQQLTDKKTLSEPYVSNNVLFKARHMCRQLFYRTKFCFHVS